MTKQTQWRIASGMSFLASTLFIAAGIKTGRPLQYLTACVLIFNGFRYLSRLKAGEAA